MRFTRKTAVLFSLLAILLVTAEAQPPERIDFYGVISPDADKNMIKMTEDLYYTQLKDFSPFVNDFREKTKSGGKRKDRRARNRNARRNARRNRRRSDL